ncbi:MAG: hypothetical protein ACRC0V_07710, partial [Fusobacteriaceae bacterium]
YFKINDTDLKADNWDKIKKTLEDALTENSFIMISFWRETVNTNDNFIAKISDIVSIETAGFSDF